MTHACQGLQKYSIEFSKQHANTGIGHADYFTLLPFDIHAADLCKCTYIISKEQSTRSVIKGKKNNVYRKARKLAVQYFMPIESCVGC